MLAQWTDEHSVYSREVDTAAEAASLIAELGASGLEPSIVHFIDSSVGLSFGYAVGREKTVLTFQYTLDPPYYASMTSSPGEDTWFWSGRQYTEYPGENMISHSDGKAALIEFFDTKKLPASVEWEML